MSAATILYVDDEPINLLAFQSQFRRDFTVHTAKNAEQALQCLAETPVDLVLSDQRMPDVTGTEFLTQVSRRFPQVHRAVISGFTEDTSIRKGLSSGVVQKAFEKPYRAGEVAEFIHHALSLEAPPRPEGEEGSGE